MVVLRRWSVRVHSKTLAAAPLVEHVPVVRRPGPNGEKQRSRSGDWFAEGM